MDILNTLSKISKITNFSTTADYVTMRFMPGMLLVCSLIMTYKQYIKSPIVCYSSVPFTGNGLADYVENTCYLSRRFYNLLSSGAIEPLNHDNIYPWLPIILLLQTASLCLPKICWIFIGKRTDLCYLLTLCNEINVKNSIHKFIDRIQAWNSCKYFLIGYLLTKLITILVYFTNILFLYYILFLQDASYPATITKQLILGNTTVPAPNSMFQSVIMCNTVVYHLSSIIKVVSQCLLTWNAYYEKIYAIITFLLIISISLTILDLIKWLIYYMLKTIIILQYLQKNMAKDGDAGCFIGSINSNVYFLILMISTNINDIVAGEIVKGLYGNYKSIKTSTTEKLMIVNVTNDCCDV